MFSGRKNNGVQAALVSALCLGIAPIFGKQALLHGFSPLAVVALRTSIAALLLFLIMAFFKKSFFYIYPVGLMGCVMAGFVNGIGSIFYYTALNRLDAGLGHLLYSFYPVFVALWLLTDRQPINRITLFRLLLAIPGMMMLVSTGDKSVDLIGAALMLSSAVLYALHLLINQRVLFEVPAQTVTFYTLLSMAVTVTVAFLIFDRQLPPTYSPWWPVLGMALFTFFSRLTLFMGVKNLGGLQTALLGLGELLVTVFLAVAWLHERLAGLQWTGAILLIASLVLVAFDKPTPIKRVTTGWLSWINSPQVLPFKHPWQ